jgi:hypothetical protein
MDKWDAGLVKVSKGLGRPLDIDLPFFAYGIFRHGEIAFEQLREFVSDDPDTVQVSGERRVRDGLPILDLREQGCVKGSLLEFSLGRRAEAYDRIRAMEPDNHYKWDIAEVKGRSANVLAGLKPKKGSKRWDYPEEWNSWDDPLFTSALDVVEETFNRSPHSISMWDLKPLFELQMAYLLLWSSIERYVSLSYQLGGKPEKKVGKFADERPFKDGIKHIEKPCRFVCRADRPDEKEVLDPRNPKKALLYCRQVRNNIAHRGKGVQDDYDRVRLSLKELLPIFREVLAEAKRDAQYSV